MNKIGSIEIWRLLVQKVTKMSQWDHENFWVRGMSLQTDLYAHSLDETQKETESGTCQYFKETDGKEKMKANPPARLH